MPRLNRKVEIVLNDGADIRNQKRNDKIISKLNHENSLLPNQNKLCTEKLNLGLSMRLVIAKIQTPLGEDYLPLLNSSSKISRFQALMDKTLKASDQFKQLKVQQNNNLAFLCSNNSLKKKHEDNQKVFNGVDELFSAYNTKGNNLQIIARPEILRNMNSILTSSEHNTEKLKCLKFIISQLKTKIGDPLKFSQFLYVFNKFSLTFSVSSQCQTILRMLNKQPPNYKPKFHIIISIRS